MKGNTKEKRNRQKRCCLWQRPLWAAAAVYNGVFAYVAAHGKKYTCLLAAFLFFILSSSFSFPVFQDRELSYAAPDMEHGGSMFPGRDAQEAIAVTAQTAEVELLDDADVLDGYEDTELENMEDIYKYTLDEILEDSGTAAEEIREAGQTETGSTVFDKDDWRLLLINKQHPIPEDYAFELGTIKGSMKCDARIIDDLLAMLQAAKDDGIYLVICSPYRDLNRQKVLFDRKVEAYMEKGMSYMDAYKFSSQAVTVPGASEHQIGLALDIVCNTYYSLNEGFGETEAGRWLQEHSHEYGFTLRYPMGKEYITGIEYEPWHFRYVGKEAAAVMREKGICLEEFVDSL